MKRLLALLIMVVLSFGTALAIGGSDFTDDEALAQKLDEVFNGQAVLFSNTKKTYKLDSYIGNGTFYIDGRVGGSQCYIYANAVYFYLFNEIPYHGEGPYKAARIELKGLREVGYDDFVSASIGLGTYIRTTNKTDGTYNGSTGHSLIVLSYDKDGITWLDANWGSPKYYVHVHTETWEYFNKYVIKSGSISHAVVPYLTSSRYALISGDITYDLYEMGISRVVAVPESVRLIGQGAFEGAGVQALIIPQSVIEIEQGAPGASVIFGFKGSAAEEYAQSHGLSFYEISEGWELTR